MILYTINDPQFAIRRDEQARKTREILEKRQNIIRTQERLEQEQYRAINARLMPPQPTAPAPSQQPASRSNGPRQS
jgi:hypothetical protein